MKVLHVIRRLEAGGGPSSTVSLVNNLAAVNDLQVHLAASPGPLSGDVEDAVHTHSITSSNPIGFTYGLSRVIRSTRPDLLHVHGSRLAIQAGLSTQLARWHGPIVTSRHSHGFRFAPDKLALRLANRFSSHTIALTEIERESLIASGAKPSEVSVIPHIIDIDTLVESYKKIDRDAALQQITGTQVERPVVSVAARLVDGKGLEEFIEVISLLRARDIGVTGIVAGSGPLESKLRSKTAAMSPPGAVRMVGFQPRIETVLAASDLVLFLSEAEVLPVFLIEAMACGLPIVARKIPSIENVVENGHSGILVVTTQEAVAAAESLLASPSLSRMYGTNAQNTVRKYSPLASVGKLVDLYRRLLEPVPLINPGEADD